MKQIILILLLALTLTGCETYDSCYQIYDKGGSYITTCSKTNDGFITEYYHHCIDNQLHYSKDVDAGAIRLAKSEWDKLAEEHTIKAGESKK